MKTPNKWEPQHIVFNHSSDIDFKGLRIFTKKILQKFVIKLLVINVTLTPDNPSRFRQNLLERV